MEELLTKIAEILDMSVDGLLVNYPILRDQYVSIYTINRLSNLTAGLMLILGLAAILVFIAGVGMWLGEDITMGLKISLLLWVVFIVIILVNIALNNTAVKLAPDLMFIREVIN